MMGDSGMSWNIFWLCLKQTLVMEGLKKNHWICDHDHTSPEKGERGMIYTIIYIENSMKLELLKGELLFSSVEQVKLIHVHWLCS